MTELWLSERAKCLRMEHPTSSLQGLWVSSQLFIGVIMMVIMMGVMMVMKMVVMMVIADKRMLSFPRQEKRSS